MDFFTDLCIMVRYFCRKPNPSAPPSTRRHFLCLLRTPMPFSSLPSWCLRSSSWGEMMALLSGSHDFLRLSTSSYFSRDNFSYADPIAFWTPRSQSPQINYAVSTTGSGALMFYLSTIKGKWVGSRRLSICSFLQRRRAGGIMAASSQHVGAFFVLLDFAFIGN